MIKDCKTAYLLGDKHWYPYQSIQLKKQLDFATDFAAHFNDDEIKHCRKGVFDNYESKFLITMKPVKAISKRMVSKRAPVAGIALRLKTI